MEEKLTAELSGILAWAIQGCIAWQRDGLTLPKAVHEATEEYRQQQDVLAAWLNDCCVVKRLADAKAADLYASYTAWCESNGERPEPQRRFGMRLTERGFQRQKRMSGHFWLGVGLLEIDHHDPNDPNDPDLAINGSRTSYSQFIGEIASYGSYGSCSPSKSAQSPPVDVSQVTLPVLPLPNSPLSKLATRLLSTLRAVPAGFDTNELVRHVGNGKGASLPMVEQNLIDLARRQLIARIGGRWVAMGAQSYRISRISGGFRGLPTPVGMFGKITPGTWQPLSGF